MKKIIILGTGGTIAGLSNNSNDNINYNSGQISINEIINKIPKEITNNLIIKSEQILQIDSKDISNKDWYKLYLSCQKYLNQEDIKSIIITHGTDTMEETAWFLQNTLKVNKPIIMTGAMRPSNSLYYDGIKNLIDSIILSINKNTKKYAKNNILINFSGNVHSAKYLHKCHPYKLDSFNSGENSPLAFIEENKIRFNYYLKSFKDKAINLPKPENWSWVEIINSYAGVNSNLLDILINSQNNKINGIIINGTGNGTFNKNLIHLIKKAIEKNIKIWICTRCELGKIVQNDLNNENNQDYKITNLSPWKARISLMLELTKNNSIIY